MNIGDGPSRFGHSGRMPKAKKTFQCPVPVHCPPAMCAFAQDILKAEAMTVVALKVVL